MDDLTLFFGGEAAAGRLLRIVFPPVFENIESVPSANAHGFGKVSVLSGIYIKPL
jgi:hypothetical protein